MKFFSELGSCFFVVPTPHSVEPLPLTEEVDLVGPPCATSRPRRSKAKAAAAQWQPALSMITEDGGGGGGKGGPALSKEKNDIVTRSKKKAASKARSGADKPRKPSIPMIIPGISPTPFMF